MKVKKILMLPVEFLKPFIMADEKVKPIRVFITILLIISIVILCKRINPNSKSIFSDEFIRNLYLFIGVLIAADTWRQNTKDKNGVKK